MTVAFVGREQLSYSPFVGLETGVQHLASGQQAVGVILRGWADDVGIPAIIGSVEVGEVILEPNLTLGLIFTISVSSSARSSWAGNTRSISYLRTLSTPHGLYNSSSSSIVALSLIHI